jgi:hypothetical protein
MLPLPPTGAGRRTRPVALPVDAGATRASHLAERAAQGLPAHLEDPAVAARVAALLLPAGSMTTPPSSRRSTTAAKAGGAR